ncbi:hypothetical protein LshimejAT787_0505280 [Lyophyllum shimeji]|uniref:Uncharacterized protein n=1 Tax=Lyophyllum shimeji TaxID=47721 RepID=A0A9P3UMH7_LYOSH|nr:hypothetical protein LshimejAT787_0505280 [Lyophyllum shimeji]
MAPHDDLLRSICSLDETFKEAQAVLYYAKQKTGRGSGFELGSHITGLPAICAYIASKRLNNNDVTRKNAQVASCLKAVDFDKALQTVDAAIAEPRKQRIEKDVYAKLISLYAPAMDRQQLLDWLAAARRALILSDNKFNADDAKVQHALFYWTYNAATSKNLTTQQEYAAEHGITTKIFTNLLNKITGCCSSVKAQIQRDVKAKRSTTKQPAATAATTPRRSPKKPARILPSKDSPTKRKAAEPPSTEQDSADEQVDEPMPETPSKKRKAESPATKPASPLKPIFPPVASSSRVTLDTHVTQEDDRSLPAPTSSPPLPQSDPSAMDVDVDPNTASAVPLAHRNAADAEDLPPARRRFRPVYVDHRQWYGVDKRVRRIWKQAEKYKAQMVDKYGHPLEALRKE